MSKFNRVTQPKFVLEDFEQPTYFEYKAYTEREAREVQDKLEKIANAKGKKATKKADEKFYKELESRIIGGKITNNKKTVEFKPSDIRELPQDVFVEVTRVIFSSGTSLKQKKS